MTFRIFRKATKKEFTRRLTIADIGWKYADINPRTRNGAKILRLKFEKRKCRTEKIVFKGKKDFLLKASGNSGKVTDCGNDRFSCIYANIPAGLDFSFEVEVTVQAFLREPGPSNREAFGIFVRDTMDPDPDTGEYYSNMAAVGGYYGRYNFFGRDGIIPGNIEHVRNYYLYPPVNRPDGVFLEDSLHYRIEPEKPVKIRIMLKKEGEIISASMKDTSNRDLLSPKDNGGEKELSGGERAVCAFLGKDGFCGSRGEYFVSLPGAFRSREKRKTYLGFFVTDGSEMVIHPETVRIVLRKEEKRIAGFCRDNSEIRQREKKDSTNPVFSGIQGEIDACRPGETVKLTSGRMMLTESLVIEKEQSGLPNKRKCLTGEVILDFGGSSHALIIKGDYWDITGISVTGGYGIVIEGSHNRIRNCQAFRNLETGILIRHPDIRASKEEWPSHNLIEDCCSFENRDRAECNADGFACKVAAGEGNIFRRCKAWLNADDGFDLFSKNRAIGGVRIEKCESFLNGYRREGEPTAGNGNGFKLGGSGIRVDHVVCDSLAERNRAAGFTSNSNPSMNLYRCAAHNNLKKNCVYYYYDGRKVRPCCNIVDCDFEEGNG